MADRRGGRQNPDNKVRPPEATGERSDLLTGLPYGQRKDVIAATQAVPLPRESNQSPTGGSPSRSRGGGRGLVKMLGKHGSMRPEQPISAGRDKFNQSPQQASTRQLIQALDVILQETPNPSTELVDLYMSLRKQELG